MKRLMQKGTALCLALMMCLTMLPTAVFAVEMEPEAEASLGADFEEESVLIEETTTTSKAMDAVVQSGTCGDNLTWTLDDAGTLTIGGSGKMEDWWERDDVPWYNKRWSVKTVIIEDGVTSIGDKAFRDCDSVTSITIPNSVTDIGDYAFYGCRSLNGITIPDSVTDIGDYAFYGCRSLTSITIPDSVTSIGEFAFYSCSGLTSITIPDGVTSVGENAFSYCSSLTSITLPSCVTSIEHEAFVGCSSLTSITIPDGVTSIDGTAFFGCSSLTGITIPDGVTSIGELAFADCSSLTSIIIPNSVTSIGDNAFYRCSSLTSITIPDGVTSIGAFAFNGTKWISEQGDFVVVNRILCEYQGNAENVDIPSGVTSIGGSAFYNCRSLTSITIPDSVISIGPEAFSSCRSLTSITIPDSVTDIGDYAFVGCSSLTSVTIPTSVTSIGNRAFGYVWDNDNYKHTRMDGFTISGYTGSAAEEYADNRGIPFVSIGVFHTHTLTKTEVKSTTCTEDGSIEYWTCSECNKLFSDAEGKNEITRADTVVQATGHKLTKTEAKAATCTEDGNIEYWTCSNCGKLFSDAEGTNEITWESTIINAAGHVYEPAVIENNVPASCTTEGHYDEVVYCTECNMELKRTTETVAALGHTWNAGVVTREPTVTLEGVKTFTCTRCQETRTEPILKLTPVALNDKDVTVSTAKLTYDGKAKQPSVTVKVDEKTLTNGTDYTVSYTNNTNAGTATVNITGKGNYTGTITKTFNIAKANQTLTVSAPASVVKGKTVNVTAKGIGAVTYKSSNTKVATVSAKGVVKGVAPGTVTITVTAAGDKNRNAATKTVKITVYACANPSVSKVENVNGGMKLTWGKVTGAAKYRIFYKTGNGGWTKLADTTSTTYTWKKAKNGTTYAFTVRCISKDGKAYTSGYDTAGKSLTYVATPTLSSVKNSKAKTMTAGWKKLSGVTGFQIQYSTDKNFKSGNKAVTVKKSAAVSQAINGLTKGKTYYVRIRSYKTVSGKNVYSAWSAAKSVKIAK